MNNRTITILLVPVLALLVLSGCFGKKEEQSVPKSTEKTSQNEESADDPTTGAPIDDSIAGKFKEMLTVGKKLECSYTMKNEDGESTQVVMIMDGEKKYRMTMKGGPEGNQYAVSDGENMHFWSEGTKQGMKMNYECIEDMAKKMESESNDSKTGIPVDASQYKYDSNADALDAIPEIDCKESLAGIDVSVPNDIAFIDQCQMMENAAKMMKESMKNIPSGMLPPNSNMDSDTDSPVMEE